jgi:hypothetical protein
MDFSEINYQDFELLVGVLLSREGFQIFSTPMHDGRDKGYDFEVSLPDSTPLYVEVKHYRHSQIPLSLLRQTVGEIVRLRNIHPTASGLLATSSNLTAKHLNWLKPFPFIQVWDGKHIKSLLTKYPDVLTTVQQSANSRTKLLEQIQTDRNTHKSRGSLIAECLNNTVKGKSGWRDFEEVGVEALSYIFNPALGTPEIQSRSDDGLDIIDAIFPIRSHLPPWSLIRAEYRTRFIVAEFKNYNDSINQKQVESISQYLWKPAQRYFGLLISRNTPSDSALVARRRAWLENEKMIVFLSDEDLYEMIQLREEGNDPFDIIDAQLEDFLRGLTP